jgi:hypothetical protein
MAIGERLETETHSDWEPLRGEVVSAPRHLRLPGTDLSDPPVCQRGWPLQADLNPVLRRQSTFHLLSRLGAFASTSLCCSLMIAQTPSPAILISPKPGSILRSTSAAFTWTAGKGPTAYLLDLGTEGKGSDNLYSSGSIKTTSVTVRDLPKSGETVYATLFSRIGGKWQPAYYTFTRAGLKALSCESESISGLEEDTCWVTLSAPALRGGTSVSLASNDRAVSVPVKVTVPANVDRAGFTAAVSAVISAQTATLTAEAGGAAKEFGLHLNEAERDLILGASGVAFGNVTLGATATQSVTLTAKGKSALTISAATLSGTGFRLARVGFPLILSPNEKVTIDVEFDPAKAGATKGELVILSNSTGGSKAVMSLSGTGMEVPYQVNLSWDPVSAETPVPGYNVYRAISGSGSYQLLNISLDTETSYVDKTVQDGVKYDYLVESVDIYGVTSEPSNVFSLTIP